MCRAAMDAHQAFLDAIIRVNARPDLGVLMAVWCDVGRTKTAVQHRDFAEVLRLLWPCCAGQYMVAQPKSEHDACRYPVSTSELGSQDSCTVSCRARLAVCPTASWIAIGQSKLSMITR